MSLQGLTAFILGLVGGLFFFQMQHAYPLSKEDPFWVMRDIGRDPPGRFVRPFNGKLVEKKVPYEVLKRKGIEGYSLLGTEAGQPACYIVYHDSRSRQHELAHCNGWPADHRREGLDRFHFAPPPPRQ